MAVVLGAWVMVSAGCASVETGPPRDVAGTWNGECLNLNCPLRLVRVVLVQDGDRLTGNVRGIGTTEHGDPEVPLIGGKVTGGRVSFQAWGGSRAARVMFEANLTLADDGKTMKGHVTLGSIFLMTFLRMTP